MSLASKPLKTGAFPAGATNLRGEAPSRPLPRLAAHEPRVVLRLPDCSPSVPPTAEPLASAGSDGFRGAASIRPLEALKQVLSKPRTLLACLVAVSAMVAVAILVSRWGQQTTKPAHDEPASTTARGEVSPPIPRTPGVTISTSERRHTPPAANHPHDTRAAAASDGKSPSTPRPNHGASLARETLPGPRGLPTRTPSGPVESESQRTAQRPWATLEHKIIH